MWCVYTMEYYSATNKNEIMSFPAPWMNLELVIQGEVSQNEKKILYINTYIWNLEKLY